MLWFIISIVGAVVLALAGVLYAAWKAPELPWHD